MRIAKATLALLCLPMLLVFGQAHAAGEDLVNCRWENGEVIKPPFCQKLRELAVRDARQIQRQGQRDAENLRIEEERKEQARIRQAAEKQRWNAAEEERRLQAEASQKRMAAESAAEEKQERIQAKKNADVVAAQKAQCGDDYRAPRIGMTLARAQQCVAKLRLTSEINRADGVVSTYTSGGMYLHVMQGKVVSWGR